MSRRCFTSSFAQDIACVAQQIAKVLSYRDMLHRSFQPAVKVVAQ